MISNERIQEIIVEHCNGSNFAGVQRAIKQAIEEAAEADKGRLDAIESGFSVWLEQTMHVATKEYSNMWFVQFSINRVANAPTLRKALDLAITAHKTEVN